MRMVNMTFTRQGNPDIRRELQKLDGAFGMNPSQLVDVAFKVSNNKEQSQKQDVKLNTVFLVAALKVNNVKEGSQEAQW